MSPLSSAPPAFRRFRRTRIFGFTLVELLGVFVVIGIIAAIALVKYEGQKEKAYQVAMLNDVRNFATLEETNASVSNSYPRPDSLAGFRYTNQVSTLGFSTEGNAWDLLVEHKGTKVVCGVQSKAGQSLRPSCATPSTAAIDASTVTPSAGETVVYDITGYLAQVASGPSAVREGFMVPTLLASSNYSNVALVAWDFGDSTTMSGPPSTASVVTHVYTHSGDYTVKVGIVGASGSVYSAVLSGHASGGGTNGNHPTAAFSVGANPIPAGTDVGFDASASSESGGSIASYQWNFGDGGTASGVAPTHTYTAAGTYSVTLKVTDSQGGIGAIQQAVTVTGTNERTLAAIFVTSPADSSVAGSAVTFTANQDPAISSYAWDFGDGSSGSGASVTHSYIAGGTYPAVLTVSGTGVISDQSTHSMKVVAAVRANQPPIAAFSVSPTSPRQGQVVSFDASGSYDPDGNIASYAWDFGDFASASGLTASHSYTAGGSETVVLTVTDNQGAATTASRTVNVTADIPPTAQFTILPAHPVTGRPTTFNGTGSSDADGTVVSYAWAYGDGATGTNATDTHTYSTGGSKVVTLTVTDDAGVSSTSSQTVTVVAPPVAAFSVSTGTPFTGQTVTLDGSGSSVSGGSISSYAWTIGGGTPASATGVSTQTSFAAAGQETISLRITDSNQNTDSVSHTVMVRVNQPPVARATVSSASAQTGQSLTFDGSTSSDPDGHVASYAWDFGDGASGSGVSATHAYIAGGNYTAMLTVTDDQGASASSTVTVAVNAPPVSSFTASATTVPTGASINFDGSASSDADGSVVGYSWNFGDGNTASGALVTHAYGTGGTHTVTLTVTDNSGATGASSQAITVVQNQPPTARFTPSATSATPGTTITFDGSGSSDSDGTVAAYAWNFGDNATSAAVSPTHAYASAGRYTASLTVTDNSGAASSPATAVITVNTPPVAAFSVSGTPAANRPVSFVSTSSDPDGQAITLSYDYGDGSSGSTGTHTYVAPGTYTVALTVTDTYGASNSVSHDVAVGGNVAPTAHFTSSPASASPGGIVTFNAASSTHDPAGSITSYAWTFGDTQTGTGVGPTHTYAASGHYTVQLTVTDDVGQTAAYTATVVVNSPPVARESVPDSAYTNGLISVSGSASTDDQGIASYDWNWGDGSAHATGVGASHAYSTVGSYTVTLTVTDGDGATNSATHGIVVTAASSPTVSFTSSPSHPTTGQAVSFTSSASSANRGGSITSYSWDFADGATSSLANPTHAFTGGGNYTVTLNVVDNLGGTGTASRAVAVNIPPAVSFTSTPSTPVSGQTITFTSSASDPDGSIASYAWNFGDGATATTANTTHAYATSGNYTTTLVVTDNLGATSQASHTFSIIANVPPTATASASPTSVQPGQIVTFTGSGSAHSTGATISSYAWDFGDGSTATTQNSTHGYSAPGSWTATLTVTDSYGQTGVASQTVTVRSPGASQYTGPSTSVVGRSNTFTAPTQDSTGSSFTSTDWNFGDGTAHATGSVATHTYTTAGTKNITLTLTNSFGNVIVKTGSVAVAAGIAPTAAFSSSPTYPVPGATTSFDGSASTANNSGGSLTAYSWDYADGALGTGVTTTHIFSAKGDYAVKLTVTDETGTTASTTHTVSVDAPVASITGATVTLSGQSQTYTSNSTDAHLTISAFSWSVSGASPTVTSGTSNSITTTFTTPGTGSVSLTVTNTGGATSTATQAVTVNPAAAPTVSLAASTTTPEPGQPVTLTATATSNNGGTITTYHYDYGDGIVKDTTASVITHTYTAGTWSATVKATDSYGASATSSAQAMTVATPTATQFTGPTTTLANQSNTFASASQDNHGYSFTSVDWNFGDGTAHATTASATHTYTTAGTRTVTLTLTNSLGNTVVQTGTVTVSNGTPPSSVFTTSVSYPDKGTSVPFNAIQSHANNSGGSIVSYAWDWGDATVGTGMTPSHAFAAAGNYTVSLKVTDNLGLTNTSAQTITVVAPVAAISGNSTVLTGQAITLTSTSTSPGGAIQNYSWSTSGVAASPATSAGSSATSFTTTFSAAGTAAVKLVITDASGTTDSTTKNVTVTAAAAPTVSLAASTTTPEPGQPVTLTATATSNNGGTITTYHYDYGDGIVKDTTASVITHTYTAGTWSATVKATDSYGASATSSAQTLTVTTPTATVTMTGGTSSTATVTGRTTNSFSASNNLKGTVNTSTYTWAWGDGTANTTGVTTTTHTFATAGTYTVTLTMQDQYTSASGSKTITVATNQPPTSTFTTNVVGNAMTTGASMTATVTSTDPEGTAMQYQWVDDGVTGSYSSTGSYTKTNVTTGSHTLVLNTKDADGAVTASATYSYTASVPVATAPTGMSLWFQGDNVSGAANASVTAWASAGGTGSSSWTSSTGNYMKVEAAAAANNYHKGVYQTNWNQVMTIPLDSVTNISVGDEMTYAIVSKNFSFLSVSTSPNTDGGFYMGVSSGQVHDAAGVVTLNPGYTPSTDQLSYTIIRVSKSAGQIKTVIGTAATASTAGQNLAAAGATTKILSTGTKPTTLNLGYYTSTGTNHANASTATYYEILVYPRALSDVDTDALAKYLNNKYLLH